MTQGGRIEIAVGLRVYPRPGMGIIMIASIIGDGAKFTNMEVI